MSGMKKVNELISVASSAEILLTDDGKMMVVEYDIGAGTPLRVGLPLGDVMDLIGKMTQISSVTADGSGFVRLTPVTAANAQPSDDPNHLILTLYDELKLAHHFAFPVELSEKIRPALRNAEAASKRGARIGRA